MVGYDLETTGVDLENDRIVQSVIVHVVPGLPPVVHKWLVDPGVPIPPEAAKVHGITDEQAREHGRAPAEALAEMRDLLHGLWRPGVPLVGHNPPFDLTMTDREFGRHLGVELPVLGPVVDTLTIDRHWWKYVKGKGMRKLVPTCARYGLGEVVNAHDAEVDATAALRLAWAESRRFPAEVGLVDLVTLHERQREWQRRWAVGFARYLDRQVKALERGLRFRLTAVMAAVLGPDVEPTPENAEAELVSLRARRDDVLAGAGVWPMRPRPVAEEVA